MAGKDKRVDIDVQIDADGKVAFEVSGVKGKGCVEYAKAIQDALGAEGPVEFTHEYWESDVRITSDAVRKIRGKIKSSE